ncbi:MAG: transporter permease, partial [Gaiellaceae bacterium]|nr:transporter permease [Gaiellaceae bacterium]
SPDPEVLPALALVVTITVVSCTALGALIGSIGLRARDVFFAANLVYFLMLLFCGVNVDVSDLPSWMEAVGTAIPLTHGIQAARQIVDGAALADVAGLVATEAAIGAAYGVAAYGLFRLFEAEGRRRASLETY